MDHIDLRPRLPIGRLTRPLLRLAVTLAVVGGIPSGATASTLAAPGAGSPPSAPAIDRIARSALSAAPLASSSSSFGSAAPSAPPVAGPSPAVGPLRPGVQYDDALAHSADRIEFTPGARVSVPFTPRAGDAWTVAGSAPVALPTGSESGRQMAAPPEPTPRPAPGAADPAPIPTADPAPIPTTDPAAARAVDSPTSSFAATPAVFASALVPARLPAAAPAAAAVPGKSLRREVFGFLPYWELADPTTRLDMALVSTIAYFSVGVNPDGGLQKRNPDGTITTGWAGWTSSRMTDVIDAAHRDHTRVVLTLSMFAWTNGSAALQARLLGDPAARATLARGAVAAVRARGADGINLDFEPLVAGHEDDFVALVRAIRARLDATARGYQLTFDTMGRIGNYPIAAATGPGGADAVFVMGYDFRTADSSNAGSIAPLGGPVYDLADTVAAYLDEIPAARIILGVPWYGRAWSTVSDALNAPTQADPRYAPSVSVTYGQALALAADGHHLRWDARESTAWFAYRRQDCTATRGCLTTWRQVYLEDDRALRLRYDLVNRTGIRGVGIWALGYEGTRTDTWKALADKFLHDTTPPEAGILDFSGDRRDEGFLVDWTARDDYSGVVSYDVEVSIDGGAWAPWLTRTTAGADVWLGRDGHAYAFRVRAKDGKSNLGAWDTASTFSAAPTLVPGGFGRVLTDGLSARDGPSPTAARRTTLSAGTIVAITDGPVSAGGFTWFEVTAPITEWSPVAAVRGGMWVAASGAGGTFLAPAAAPNSTRVTAGISGLSFGGVGLASVGPAITAASRRAISPNGDGSGDTLRLDWHARVSLDSLTLRVYGADGTLLGSRPLPAGTLGAGDRSFAWDGTAGGATGGTGGEGAALADGRYILQLVGVAGGTTYAAPSTRPVTPAQIGAYAVTVDTVAPTNGRATISGRRISPNGDGVKDAVTVTGSATGANRWSLTVTPMASTAPAAPGTTAPGTTPAPPAAAPVRSIGGAGSKAAVTWDGRGDDGAIVPDGVYLVTMRNLDWAGNGPTASWTVLVDTRAPIPAVAPNPALISPNGDGAADRTVLRGTSDEGAAGTIEISAGTRIVRRIAVAAGRAGSVVWDGRADDGSPVPDGRYVATLRLADPAGNPASASTAVVVDRTLAGVGWSAPAFDAIDGDALAATATLEFRLTRPATTSLRIEDTAGTVVRNAWRGRAGRVGGVAWTWDGRDGHHDLVPAGRYVAVLTVTGPLGTSEVRRPVVVDVFLVAALPRLVPAGGLLTLAFTSVEPLRSTPTVTVAGPTGTTVQKVTATKAGPGRFIATVRIGVAGPVSIVIAARDTAGGANVTRLALVAG